LETISDTRFRDFILQNLVIRREKRSCDFKRFSSSCVGLEPSTCRSVWTKADKLLRKCSMVRELLNMSPSALVLGVVHGFLVASREDVLVQCLKSFESFEGLEAPFDDECASADTLLFESFQPKALVSCPATICRRYASFALKNATNRRNDLGDRVDAIKRFMDTPTTQHSDVLLALQSDLEDAVREVLINRVFSLDSPWHILGFLLSQGAIEKTDQRVTAALLGYVAKHVHVSKVVRVVEILLSYPRRRKLSFQLHKAVVRMLFDAKTDHAQRLLRSEWKSKLPLSVRNLMVEKCMQQVLVGEIAGWEASVLSQVATDKSLELETKFCLFSPQFGCTDPLSIPKAEECETDELLEKFGHKGPSPVYVSLAPVADTFHTIFQQLEETSDGSLRVLAKCKKLSLAHLFGPNHRDDQGVLDEILQLLSSPLEVNHENQLAQSFLSHLFAAGVSVTLHHSLSEQKTDLQSIKDVATVCEQNTSAFKFKVCVQTQVNELLDLPVRAVSRRKQLLKSLQTMLQTLQHKDVGGTLLKVLFTDPLKSELDLLNEDASLVYNLTRSTSAHMRMGF
jgi:hypothetical protein